jgi:hypothetical protein
MFSIRKTDTRDLRSENSLSGTRFDNSPDGFIGLHEHIASIERAVYEETDRRMSAQEQLREQVDLRIKTAIERLADATETEMARMYRRLEADITNRLDGFSRELATFSSALTKLNRQVEVITVELRQNRDRQVQIQKRFGIGLPESSEPMPESSSRVVSEMNKLHEVVQSDLKNSKRINELNDVARKVMSRLDSVEEWLKENLTPEILRLKESIKVEQTLREEHDKEIMQLVGQYTDIMRRHFESAALDDHAPARSSSDQDEGNDYLVSAPLPVNRLAGRRKLIRKLIEN